MLRLPDFYGLNVCQLAVQLGHSLAVVVTGLMDGLKVAASTVEAWWSGVEQAFATWVSAIESYLGLPLDFSCYVEVDNTRGASDLVLTGSSASYGSYTVTPPTWIPKGTVGRFILQDSKPSGSGSDGTATYKYCDNNLGVKSVTFSYEDPYWWFNDNRASSSQADSATWSKTDRNGAWGSSVPTDGHPLYVGYVIGGGQPA